MSQQMNMRRHGFNEKWVFAYNPLPAGHSEQSLLARAEIPPTRFASKLDVFRDQWEYGTGLEKEVVLLQTGDPETAPDRMLPLRESEARDFMREKQEIGMVLLEEPGDLAHVIERSIQGLRIAHDFWHERGKETLIELQMKAGYSEAEMKAQRGRNWKLYANEQAALVIEDHIEKLEAQLEALRNPKVGVEAA